MQRIEIKKHVLEEFIDSLKGDFNSLKGKEIKKLGFNNFKEYFCNDKLLIYENKWINKPLCKKNTKCKKLKQLKKIYEDISSSNSNFFKKIREFIITNFTKHIKFCPYCGKVPLIYFEKGKDKINSYRRLFQLDHFFPKNIYQTGIINFYNLIPSCNACNHLKLEDNPLKTLLSGGNIFHPYFGYLSIENNTIKKGYENSINTLSFNDSSNAFFKLPQKYLNSQDTFNVFNFIYDKYTKIKDEYQKFRKTSKSIEEFVDYFFKNYYPEKEQDILKYSNGKLKKDLIQYMKQIFKNYYK